MKKLCGRAVFPSVWVCKCHSFGDPHIRPLYIACSMIIGRYLAGERIGDIAIDYAIRDNRLYGTETAEALINAAIRWGLLSRDRRARLIKRRK